MRRATLLLGFCLFHPFKFSTVRFPSTPESFLLFTCRHDPNVVTRSHLLDSRSIPWSIPQSLVSRTVNRVQLKKWQIRHTILQRGPVNVGTSVLYALFAVPSPINIHPEGNDSYLAVPLTRNYLLVMCRVRFRVRGAFGTLQNFANGFIFLSVSSFLTSLFA